MGFTEAVLLHCTNNWNDLQRTVVEVDQHEFIPQEHFIQICHLLDRIAVGNVDRQTATSSMKEQVTTAYTHMLELLFPANLWLTIPIPEQFWESAPIGSTLLKVLWWLYAEDFISIAEAADLLFPLRSKSARRQAIYYRKYMRRLYLYPNPHVVSAAPLRRMLRRSQLEALRDFI